MGTELEAAGVPDLEYRPQWVNEADVEDLQKPVLYRADYKSRLVEDGKVKAGSFFVATSHDDDDYEVVYEPGADKGVVMIPLLWQKYRSRFDSDGRAERYPINGPWPETEIIKGKKVKLDEPKKTYEFLCCLPDVSAEFPHVLRLSSSSFKTGRMIVSQTAYAAPAPPWSVGVELYTAKRQSTIHRYIVVLQKRIELTQKQKDIAAKLAEQFDLNPQKPQLQGPDL